MWYDLTVQHHSDTGKLSAEVYIPADSKWFDGHFPGNPVLPGIAQLGMAFELIGIMLGTSLHAKEVSRVRFKQMILPGDRVVVSAERKTKREGLFAFRITKDDELVCSGNMTVGTST